MHRPQLAVHPLMDISVVIPAHNEEKALPYTLQALTTQSSLPTEIIVVANACADRTAEIAERHGALTVVTERRGVANARNLGAKRAKGDVLLFLDADAIPAPDFIEALRRATEGRERFIASAPSRADHWRFLWTAALINLVMRVCRLSNSGVIACPASLFREIGGFPSVEMAEDYAFMRRAQLAGAKYLLLRSHFLWNTRRMRRFGAVRTLAKWLEVWLIPSRRALRYPPVR
ncbi:glycosyltransferase [Candidatus Woesearchaeota archaeon]|nr:glycosyltransferase [Candidatus Woesearchaeota archaeon]